MLMVHFDAPAAVAFVAEYQIYFESWVIVFGVSTREEGGQKAP